MRRLLLALLAALPFAGFAQQGANSDCAHAIALQVSPTNVQVEFTAVDGRTLPSAVPNPVTTCSGSANHGSAWFSFVATSSTHWIRSEGDDMDESSLEVFSGSCGSLTSVVCIPSNSETPMVSGLTPGATYYIRVITINPVSCTGGQCQIHIAVVSAPTNDECSGAIELPVRASSGYILPTTEISTLGATQSQAACTGGATASNDDVWYRFTATQARHFFPTTVLSGDVPTVQWFSGACGSLTSIACGTDAATGLVPGQEYHIRVHSTSTTATVYTRALADVFPPAANDECSDAVAITVTSAGEQPAPVRLSNMNGTGSTVPCGTATRDVWLTFTAPATSVVAVCNEFLSGALFSGSCGSLTCVSQGSLNTPFSFTGLTPGQNYYLKVGSSVTFTNATVWLFAPPANDECSSAVDLTMDGPLIDGYDYGATQSMPQTCGGTPNDVWYRFTATGTRHMLAVQRAISLTSLHAEVFSGTCGSLTSIFCQTVPNSGDVLLTGLTAGSSYYVRVYGGGFRVSVRSAAPNDECVGAIVLPFTGLANYNSITAVSTANAADGTGGCDALRDLWYTFTAAHSTAAFVAPVINGSGTGIELLTGTCGALTSIVCLTDMAFVRAKFSGLVVGTQYFIRLSSLSPNSFRPLLFDQPANNEITGALDVPVTGSTFAQPLFEAQNYAATTSLGHWCGAGANPDDDTWFHFTATGTTHTITASPTNMRFAEPDLSYPYLRIQAFDTLSTDSTLLAANMIGCGESLFNASGLLVGHDYWYRVYTYGGGSAQTCAFTTGVSSGNNDEATGAATLTYGNDYCAIFNTTGATQSQPGADCSVADFADDDIWFKFTATASAARIVVGYHTADLTLELFSGTPGNLTSIACSDNILVLPALTVGQTYYARLYSWKNATPVSGRIGLFITPSLTANSCVDEACLGPVLLENPSIEQGANCLVAMNDGSAIEGLGTTVAPGWPRMQGGSSDGHSSCAQYNSWNEVPNKGSVLSLERVLSRNGKGMGGVFMKDDGGFGYVEYLQAALTEPLVPGEPYLVSFHAANIPAGNVCLNGLGAALSVGPLATLGDWPLEVEPQIEHQEIICGTDWVNVCGVVVPDGPFDHITIGTFREQGEFLYSGNTAVRSYYFIDDVVVAHVTDPGCVTGIGDVPPLDENSNGDEGDDLRVYPNPASDRVTIMLDAAMSGKRGVIEVYDVTGKRVHGEEVSWLNALQRLDLSAEWREGLYVVVVRVDGQAPRSARIMIRR